MAPHSSTLAWKIPWTEEPGRLQSMRSLRVRHDWATSFSLFTFMHWRRKWQPTPVFLPGESQGRPGGRPSMGSHRVRHNWSDLAAAPALRNLIAFETNTVEIMCVCSITQLCLTLCDPMDCSLPGSFVPGIFQKWVAISISRVSSRPWDQTYICCIVGSFLRCCWILSPSHCLVLWCTKSDIED